MTVTEILTRGKTRPRMFRGIVRAARDLKVSRQHLYLVLIGERHSPRIQRALSIRRPS